MNREGRKRPQRTGEEEDWWQSQKGQERFPIAWGCPFWESHIEYLEFICKWDVNPVATLLMCIYTQISLHLTTLTSECIPLEKSQQWSLACMISFERDAWMRTSNNCSCQDSKFLLWLHKNKGETHKPTRYLKNQWKSALSLLLWTLPCIIPSPRSPGLTDRHHRVVGAPWSDSSKLLMAPGTGRAGHTAAMPGGRQPNATVAARPCQEKWSWWELT